MQENSEPTQGNFTFAAGDQIAKLAHQQGMLLRGMYGYVEYAIQTLTYSSVYRAQLCLA